MSAVRLYADEDAGEHAVVQAPRARGINVLTTAEASRLGATDAEQLAFAAAQSRTIYTFNAGDFARLHAEYCRSAKEHAGVVVIPDQRYTVGEKIKRLAAFVGRTTAEEMLNRIEFL